MGTQRFRDTDYPTDTETLRVFIQYGPDTLGRYDFVVLWLKDDGQRRGQFFSGDLGEHISRERRAGFQVEVIHTQNRTAA